MISSSYLIHHMNYTFVQKPESTERNPLICGYETREYPAQNTSTMTNPKLPSRGGTWKSGAPTLIVNQHFSKTREMT